LLLPQGKRAPKKKRTDVNLELAVKDVGGFPADIDKLRAAFYRHHGGTKHAANMAFNRAITGFGVDDDGKLVQEDI
jgi:hypothetical protein